MKTYTIKTDIAPAQIAHTIVETGRVVSMHVGGLAGCEWCDAAPESNKVGAVKAKKPIHPLHELITIEPGKCGGKPCIRGLRITVCDVLRYLASGMTEAELLRDFPDLTKQDVRACLAFAIAVVESSHADPGWTVRGQSERLQSVEIDSRPAGKEIVTQTTDADYEAPAGAVRGQRELSQAMEIDKLRAALKAAEERAKLLLDAKNHWMEKASSAEARAYDANARAARCALLF